jgi:putative inorganic carbon (hco3(-)) transporter
MPARVAWRPSWWVWGLLGLAALATIAELTPGRLQGWGLAITPIAIVVCVLVVRRLWELPPAATMCAAIALSVFSGAWDRIGLGGLPFDRLLVAIVLLQFLLRAPGVADLAPLRFRNIHLLMALTIVYVVGSAAAAGTLTDEGSALNLIDQFGVIPFLVFVIAPAVFAGERERNMLLATLVGLGAYLGLTAIFESLGPHALVFPRYILDVDTILPGERAGGPFQSSVAEGFATFGCAVAAVIAFGHWRGERKRYLAMFVVVVCAAACFLTLERGVWLGVIAATLVTAVLTRTGRRWIVPGALVCAVVFGGALAASSTLAHKTTNRVTNQRSIWDRQNQTSAGLRMLKAKPLFGFGWDRYTTDSLDYFRQADGYPMIGYSLSTYRSIGKLLPLHETYLAYAVELGLIGLVLWLATVLWGTGEAAFARGASVLRPWKLGLIAVAICFLAIGLVNPDPAPFSVLLLWTWAGVASGSPRRREQSWAAMRLGAASGAAT